MLDSGAEGPGLMAAHHQVYDSRHLQADCQELGSASEPYTRKSSMRYLYLYKGAEQQTHWLWLLLLLSINETDGRTNRYIGPALHLMQAASVL